MSQIKKLLLMLVIKPWHVTKGKVKSISAASRPVQSSIRMATRWINGQRQLGYIIQLPENISRSTWQVVRQPVVTNYLGYPGRQFLPPVVLPSMQHTGTTITVSQCLTA